MMFGGGLSAASSCANDVWVVNLSLETPSWTLLNPTGGPPVPRIFHSAVYDPASNRMIVFGGNNCVPIGGTYYNDVWVLSNANGLGGTPVWTQLPVSGGPSARQGASVAYDPRSNRLIVFGGFGQQVPYNDVWVLSNANGSGEGPFWTQLSPAGAAVPPRDFASAAYDATSNRMTIFGGLNVGQLLGDTWTLSFANGLGGTPSWTQLSPLASPSAREAQATVYDPGGNRMIIFGGIDASGYLNDTWVLPNANGLAPSVPTLSVVSAHSGNFIQGQSGVYTVTVSNQAGAPATSGMVTVTDTLPGGLTLSSMTGLTGATNWTCAGNSCSLSVPLSAGASSDAITVTVNVGADAGSPVVNSVSVSGGGSVTAVATDSTIVQTAPNTGPAPLSVTPSSGSGTQQTFVLQYADPLGATDLASVWVWITSNFSTASSANSCLAYYARAANQLFLLNDAGTAFSSPATPGVATGPAVTLSNSQCSINVAAATVATGPSGQNLVVSLPVAFTGAYAGAKSAWMYAAGAAANSGWQAMGTWTVPALSVPAPVSVTPNGGTGIQQTQQTFALQYADPLGATDLSTVWVWFTSNFNTGSSANSCLAYYSSAANQIFLLNDAGTAYSSAALGAAVTLSNSQCSVNVAAASVTSAAMDLTLNLPVTFANAYHGTKSIYMFAAGSSAISGWQALGSWIVPLGSGPEPVSVTPGSGSGASQTFALQYADTLGATDLSAAWVWFTSNFNTVSSANSCIAYYARATNQILLINDAGTAYSSATPGSPVTLTNSNCSINAVSATVVPSGNNLTVNLPMTFAAGFAGAKSVFMFALGSGANSGWQPMGTWTVPLSSAPAPVSVTPVSGSGLSQTFAFQYADTLGATDLSAAWVWFTSNFNTVSSANSCIAYYVRATNQVNLINDAGTAILSSAAPGAAVTLSNSQCSLNMATATIVTSGNNLTVNLPVTFTAGYAGAKGIFMFASGSSANSGWQSMGTWTVP
jgi:uncharacterized repeat protein (TIGR01451 family)